MRFIAPHRKKERGVTILIVGISLLALVAMAALAIDVASIYQAHSEAQRAADAAALAGAKIFVTSGYTSSQTGWIFNKLCRTGGPGLNAAANRQAEAAAAQNLIAGQPASVKTISCTPPAIAQNPQLTVTVQRIGAPTFFARIWGTASSTVTATATAEAYNPSGRDAAIDLTDVKPWALPNCDPSGGSCPSASGYFINPLDGTVLDSGFIGNELLLRRETSGKLKGEGNGASGTNVLEMYALRFPNSPAPLCPSSGAPSCSSIGADKYIDDIACASRFHFQCGQQIGVGQTITATSSVFGTSPTREGARCLIHAEDDDLGLGQDVLALASGPGAPPMTITGGFHNPNTSLQNVANISRSDSIVTVPLYNGDRLLSCGGGGGTCTGTVIGFLQLGILRTMDNSFGNPQLDVVVLNAVGCSPGAVAAYPSANPIAAGSSSPVLVRLVQSP